MTVRQTLLQKPILNNKVSTAAVSAASVLAIGTASAGVASANPNYHYTNPHGHVAVYHHAVVYTQTRRVYDPYLRRWVVVAYYPNPHAWRYVNAPDRNDRYHTQGSHHYNNVYWN